MKLFIDANILIAVLNKEYPVFTYAAKVLSLPQTKRIQLYTSPACIAITFYFASKKSGEQRAKEKIALLSNYILLADNRQKDLKDICSNKKINDVEDGLQYYAAKHSGCSFIITENTEDYYFSKDIPALSAERFLDNHILK